MEYNKIEDSRLNDWIRAGKVAYEAVEYSKKIIKRGARFYDVAEMIEKKIRELGCEPGFPVNLSTNEFAAHMTPKINDDMVFEDQVVKVDIGTSCNGAIGDTAYTIDLSGKYNDLIKASVEALENAIKILRPGVKLGEIGRTIQETIESHGYVPVRNLSGHGLGLYSVHSPPGIPNFDNKDNTELKEGQIVAIEPFATDGHGLIKEHGSAEIFSMASNKAVRSRMARELLREIEKYNGLPFAKRHLAKRLSPMKISIGLRELLQNKNLEAYPPLVEVNKGIVSQHEHSFIIGEKLRVLTKH